MALKQQKTRSCHSQYCLYSAPESISSPTQSSITHPAPFFPVPRKQQSSFASCDARQSRRRIERSLPFRLSNCHTMICRDSRLLDAVDSVPSSSAPYLVARSCYLASSFLASRQWIFYSPPPNVICTIVTAQLTCLRLIDTPMP